MPPLFRHFIRLPVAIYDAGAITPASTLPSAMPCLRDAMPRDAMISYDAAPPTRDDAMITITLPLFTPPRRLFRRLPLPPFSDADTVCVYAKRIAEPSVASGVCRE